MALRGKVSHAVIAWVERKRFLQGKVSWQLGARGYHKVTLHNKPHTTVLLGKTQKGGRLYIGVLGGSRGSFPGWPGIGGLCGLILGANSGIDGILWPDLGLFFYRVGSSYSPASRGWKEPIELLSGVQVGLASHTSRGLQTSSLVIQFLGVEIKIWTCCPFPFTLHIETVFFPFHFHCCILIWAMISWPYVKYDLPLSLSPFHPFCHSKGDFKI